MRAKRTRSAIQFYSSASRVSHILFLGFHSSSPETRAGYEVEFTSLEETRPFVHIRIAIAMIPWILAIRIYIPGHRVPWCTGGRSRSLVEDRKFSTNRPRSDELLSAGMPLISCMILRGSILLSRYTIFSEILLMVNPFETFISF